MPRNREKLLAYRREYSRRPVAIASRHRYRKESQKWKKAHVKSQQAVYVRKRAWVNQYKISRGCKICGYNKWPEALDFDHKDPKTKLFWIARNIDASWAKLQAEIDKCIILCANCHRHKSRLQAKRRQKKIVDGMIAYVIEEAQK